MLAKANGKDTGLHHLLSKNRTHTNSPAKTALCLELNLSRNLLRDSVELQSLGFIKRPLSDRGEKYLQRNFYKRYRDYSIAGSHIDPGKGTGIPLNLDAARASLQEEDAFYPSLVWHVL